MTKAYQHDRAAMIAGASYAGPIWGVLIDVVVFGSIPTLRMLAGGALIIASGMVFLRRG
jgi:drug/metabolite transporter (DMT)-like permease